MRPRWLMALLVLLQEVWSARRDAQIRFLKVQFEMVQSRLPGNQVIPDPVERKRLMKIGAEMGHAVEHTLGVVSIRTYRRWLREERGGRTPGKVGRSGLTKSLRDLILRLARENADWGVRRIVGELRKLALKASRIPDVKNSPGTPPAGGICAGPRFDQAAENSYARAVGDSR